MNLKIVALTSMAIVALGTASTAAQAAPESLTKRLDRLERENRELRREFEALQKENARHDQDARPAVPTPPSPSVAADQPPSPPTPAPSLRRTAPEPGLVNLNSRYSYTMLDPTTSGKSKPLALLKAKQEGVIGDGAVYLGGALTAVADYQAANQSGNFGYLMRIPENQVGKAVSEAVLHSFQLNFTANITSWLSANAEALWDPEQSFGAGTITALSRNEFQLRRGYVLFGDLDAFPAYFMIGKIDSPFGQTDTVNPFSLSSDWHAFSGLSYGALLGYSAHGVNVSAEAVQGGAEFRGLNTPVGGTGTPSSVNNYVLDANYALQLGEHQQNRSFLVGASYEGGSSYCQSFPIAHFNPCSQANPAYAFYATLQWDAFELKGEYMQTVHVWPGTFNPNPPLDVFPASKVSSFDVGAKYTTTLDDKPLDVSLDFSSLNPGPRGAPWERQNQAVAGVAYFLMPNVKLFSEVVLIQGYSPLAFISGGNPSDPAGTTDSNRDARSQVVLTGVNLAY
jgi:hypothetical protein